jgi:hypothetical protein
MADQHFRDHSPSGLHGTLTLEVQKIQNVTDGTVVHLGDGRRLAPGESLEVTANLARELRAGSHCR